MGSAFAILGLSSLIHAGIHALHLNLNLLYLTLLGYCLGFLTLIVAISSARPQSKKKFPILFLPLLLLFFPEIYNRFPIFREFRPLVWIGVAYFAGVVCTLHGAAFYLTKNRNILLSAVGFLLVCISSIFLFFPAAIGSPMWLHGHLFRPVGFLVLLFSVNRSGFTRLGSSILYRAMTAFSLLAAIPLLIFGTMVFYEHINPIDISGRRLLVFVLMLVTFASALIFGLGMIFRLIMPILELKESVDRLVDEGLSKSIEVKSSDEIGALSNAFNEMVVKLGQAVDEQERLCRLAATGELAATLAHEIKNPLNAIGGAACYIRKNYQGRLIEEFIKIISDEVSRINKLTTTLLGFAKPLQPETAPCDINKLVQETIFLLDKEAQEQQIHLTARLDDELPVVHCDSNQIKQILINLIINAFDAIAGAGEVVVTTSRANGRIVITVRDSGTGIDPETIKYVFNPFFTTKTRGTGLGLAISKKIAREHRGDLAVESVQGAGSTFTLTLQGGNGRAA